MRCAPFLFVPVLLHAQPDQVFDVQSRLVAVPVTVTDARGRNVDGLQAADFRLFDDGHPVKLDVDTLSTGVAPIALVIAVQASGISVPVLAKVRAIVPMIQPLVTGERGCASLVSFAEQVQWLAECTKDPDALDRAFAALKAGESKKGRMLDAANEAIARLAQRTGTRRILLLISESRDRSSEAKLDEVRAEAQRASVTVYAATYSAFTTAFTTRSTQRSNDRSRATPPRNDPRNPPRPGSTPVTPPPEQRVDILGGLGELKRLGDANTTEELAAGTGGTTFGFTRQKGLEEVIERLGAELHSQYLLTFAPQAAEPGYHRLEVRLARQGGYQIRARPGYWAK